jgi:hypothetical protein
MEMGLRETNMYINMGPNVSSRRKKHKPTVSVPQEEYKLPTKE